MFSDLATLRATLAERLTPQLPADWRMVDHIEGYTESLVPVVFFEFTEFGSSAGGQPLPRSAVAASVDVVVTTPRTDYDGGAETDVDSHVLRIVQVIVQADDLYFSTARKVQLDNGPLAWRVSLTALTSITPLEGE